MTQKKLKEKPDWKVICLGIVALTALEMYALSQGINGTLFTAVIAIIGLAIGVTIPNPFKK